MPRLPLPGLATAATLALLALAACSSATPTPPPQPPTPTPLSSTGDAPTPSVAPTPTVADAPTLDPTSTPSPSPTPTAMPTPTPTPTPSPTPTATPSPTPTPPFPWTAFGPGTWRVGEQIVPGVYEAANVSGQCEWARLSRLDDSGEDVIFSETTAASASVSILPTDAGFRASDGCGHWTMWVPPMPTPTFTPTPTATPYHAPPPGWRAPEQHTTLSSGELHTCALRQNGTPVCWGYDVDGQASPPEGERFASISSGSGHTCALRQMGPLSVGGTT